MTPTIEALPRRIVGTLTVKTERGIVAFDERVKEACEKVHEGGQYIEAIHIVKDVIGIYAVLVVSERVDISVRRQTDGPSQ